MTGGAEKYSDRGMIPRSVSYLFDSIRKAQNQNFIVFVSYLEIYNNVGYDLLCTDASKGQERRLDMLDRVVPYESEGELKLKGLKIHKGESEEDLLNLLFIGDTNRVVCETPMNDVSTRSHCVFTIYIEARETNSEVKRKSKVHLVDLSGSERVGKTGLDGTRLQEACSINLSLHYLEHVIICLQKKMKGENVFIPYRNSLMTMMLKDSLGGNCITRMVATIHPKNSNLSESISTCQFAQRVAMIKNKNIKNEIIDPDVIIAKLKRENEELKSELLNFRDGSQKTELTEEDIRICEKWVDDFIRDKSENFPMVITDKLMINHSFYYFRNRFFKLEKRLDSNQENSSKKRNQTVDSNNQSNTVSLPLNELKSQEEKSSMQKEISKLKMLNLQKDNEISILLKMLKKHEEKSQPIDLQPDRQLVFTETTLANGNLTQVSDSFPQPKEISHQNSKDSLFSDLQLKSKEHFTNNFFNQKPVVDNPFKHFFTSNFSVTANDLNDKKFCFELFRKNYISTSDLEENMISLKQQYDNGKNLTKLVRESKEQIEKDKEEIEALRKKTEIVNLTKAYNGEAQISVREEELHSRIMKEKHQYVTFCDQLKTLKQEIERMENDIKRRRTVMQSDFEKWYDFNMSKTKCENYSGSVNMSSVVNLTVNKSGLNEDLSTKGGSNTFQTEEKSCLPGYGNISKDIENFYKARNDAFKKMMSSEK